jgi:hypothetical protein
MLVVPAKAGTQRLLRSKKDAGAGFAGRRTRRYSERSILLSARINENGFRLAPE